MDDNSTDNQASSSEQVNDKESAPNNAASKGCGITSGIGCLFLIAPFIIGAVFGNNAGLYAAWTALPIGILLIVVGLIIGIALSVSQKRN